MAVRLRSAGTKETEESGTSPQASEWSQVTSERLSDSSKSLLLKASEGNDGCRNVARSLLGPSGPLPPVFKSQGIPAVARKRT